jgi:hypothetical protein
MAKKTENVEFENGISTEAASKDKTTLGEKIDNLVAKARGLWQKHKGKVLAIAATAGGVALYQNFKKKAPVNVPEVDLSAEGVALMGASDQVDVPFDSDPLAVTTE